MSSQSEFLSLYVVVHQLSRSTGSTAGYQSVRYQFYHYS